MPKYVAGKDLKQKPAPRLLSGEGSWYDKQRLIQTVITIIHGERRRKQLTKILNRLSRDQIVVLESVFRNGAQKEAEAHIKNLKETT